MGSHKKSAFDEIISTKEGRERLTAAYDKALLTHNVVTNIDPGLVDADCDAVICYAPSMYIIHIEISGREDLLENFDDDTLESWAMEAIDLPKSVVLDPGVYVEDVIDKIAPPQSTILEKV